MNDLLAKPYLPEQLFAMVAKWCTAAALPGGPNEQQRGVKKALPVYDRDAALAIVCGDVQEAQSMLDEFFKGLPECEQKLRMAQAGNDWPALYHEVHKLAGSTPVVGAMALHASAVFLQNYLKADPRPVKRIDEGLADLLAQIARFREAIAL